MALDHYVEDGGINRFSIQAFINGCLADTSDDGYEELAVACSCAKDLAETYFGDGRMRTESTPGGTRTQADFVVTGPDGTEYVTRWITQKVDGEGNPVGPEYLVTVEHYELAENSNGRFRAVVPVTYNITIMVDAEDVWKAGEEALAIAKAMEFEEFFERAKLADLDDGDGEGASFGDPVVTDMYSSFMSTTITPE